MTVNGIHFDLIVALGNPGEEYRDTRHNAGFMVLDAFADTCKEISSEFKVPGGVARKFLMTGHETYVLKPLKFMNLSGEPVAAFIAKKNIISERILAVHDEMDVETGKIKFSFASGAGGHNGVQSLIDCVGSANFARLRVGIGKSVGSQGADYVLSKFGREEKEIFKNTVELCVSAIKFCLVNGIQASMNKYNKRNDLPKDENKENGIEIK